MILRKKKKRKKCSDVSRRNFARRSDVHCRPKREASREIDEHPETLKTCRRSAIGTRASAIIGNRSALMDRYRGSFPLRSPLFLFFLSLAADDVEEDEEEVKKNQEEKGTA